MLEVARSIIACSFSGEKGERKGGGERERVERGDVGVRVGVIEGLNEVNILH